MKRKVLITLCALVVGTWVLGANRIQVSTDPVGVVQEEATEAQEIIEVAVEPEREMQFIYVDVENADLEVFAGESIDLKSMPMYVKYSDETVKKLDTDLVTFSAIDTTEYALTEEYYKPRLVTCEEEYLITIKVAHPSEQSFSDMVHDIRDHYMHLEERDLWDEYGIFYPLL